MASFQAEYAADRISAALVAGVTESRMSYVSDYGNGLRCCAAGLSYVGEHIYRGEDIDGVESVFWSAVAQRAVKEQPRPQYETCHLVVADYVQLSPKLIWKIEELHLFDGFSAAEIIVKLRAGELDVYCDESFVCA